VPEVVAAVRALPAATGIFDGEAIALRADGTPHPFQVTMSRFGRKRGVEELSGALPLSTFLFDCLLLDDVPLLDEPQHRRFDALVDQADALVVRNVRRPTRPQAAAFVSEAIAAGHEGVMVKAVDSPYAAGRRGRMWVKVKAARTLDLVVLAAEWGSGRRKGYLSNLHLGARDPLQGGFVMLGKTFKGLTDEMLAWQTQRLLELEVSRDSYAVHVRPELVVEIAFNEVQSSPRYPGGLALRFARVKGYRPDKRPVDADTIDTVRALHGP
jgi:DNA ligase-1